MRSKARSGGNFLPLVSAQIYGDFLATCGWNCGFTSVLSRGGIGCENLGQNEHALISGQNFSGTCGSGFENTIRLYCTVNCCGFANPPCLEPAFSDERRPNIVRKMFRLVLYYWSLLIDYLAHNGPAAINSLLGRGLQGTLVMLKP